MPLAGYVEASVACTGSKPHLLRWPWSKAPEHLSCEDPAVRDKYRCEAPNIDKTDWPVQWVPWLEQCRIRPQKILFLGLGGGYYQSYLASQCPASRTLTLENNATIVEAARDFFGFQGDVMLADATSGMKHLLKHGEKFDAVISDLGQRQMESRDLKLAQKLLRPGGTFLFQWCYGGLRKHEMKLDKMMDAWLVMVCLVWAWMLLLKIQIFQVADTLPNLTPDVISDPEMFYPIGTLVPNMELVMGLQALLGLITWLRVLKYLTLSRTFLPFVRVFERCFIALIKYSALLSVALFGFAVAIYIGFGTEAGIYNSIWSTFVAVAVAPAGGVDLGPVTDKNNSLDGSSSLVAPIILFSYIIVVVLLVLTTFNAIQIDSYSVTTYELSTLKRHKAPGAGGDPTIIFIWTYLNALKGVKLVGKAPHNVLSTSLQTSPDHVRTLPLRC
ncbi:pkd2 [Symbiodinium sp. CCMP2592]|nr:pkd2 [Symbiodinium sp. CCMP2592]